MSNDKTFFNTKNVLICWNDGDFAKDLVAKGYNVATSFVEFNKKYKVPDSVRDQENRIAGLVVLCELQWGLSTEMEIRQSVLSAMSGIEFVKELRRVKMKIPVVFVSFLSRAQQLNLCTANEIISTQVLGHFYKQLPSTPNDWIISLNEFKQDLIIKELTMPELEDIKSHFCNPEDMLRELKHDLLKYLITTTSERSRQFEKVFQRIYDIIGSSAKLNIEELKKFQHESDKEYNNKIDQVSRAIDDFICKLNPQRQFNPKHSKPIKVVFLDDEIYTDKRFATLIKLLGENNFVVQETSNPTEAYDNIVMEDKENQLDIIISDYRIWKKDEVSELRLMDQMQGYAFLKKCSELGRTYTYVVLSALDRNFLMHQYDLSTETFYKNGVLANIYSMLNFIQRLIDLGELNRKSLAANFSTDPNFILAYNWYRDRTDKGSIDIEINSRIDSIISLFKNKVLIGARNCQSKRGRLDCSSCEIYNHLPKKSQDKLKTLSGFRSNYSKRNWNPLNLNDIKKIQIKFSARRLFFFYVLFLKKYNCLLAEDIADNLVDLGYINVNNEYKLTCSLDPHKVLWIGKNNVESHITPEDTIFLYSIGLTLT